MAAARLLNLLALSALATLLSSFGAQPMVALAHPDNQAISFGRNHLHQRVADKKRSSSKKCRARPSSSPAAPAPTSSAAHTSTHHTTTTTSAKAAPTQPSGGGSDFFTSGSKLGLAWPDGNAGYLSNLQGARMMYTWGATCPSNAGDLGMTCLPQLWGWKNVDAFTEAAKTANPPLFLTFNEPQESGQSNMDVGSGVTLWKQAVKPLTDKGHKVCSPATSSNPNGLTWVKNFVKECPECTFDYTCIHWYDTTFEKFQTYVNLWHDTFGKPVIVTEFGVQNFNGGGQPSSGEVFSFMDQAIPWMDSTSWLLAYFPFGFMAPPTGINPNMNLLNGDGSVTSLGWVVLNKSGAN